MGYKKVILRNSAKCLRCGEEVESKHVHDYKPCKCGAMAVDGGLMYLKRTAEKFDEVEDTSEEVDCSDYVWDILVRLPASDWKTTYEKITNHLKQRDEEDRLRREERERKQP
jgi:hypothetical protein